MIDLTCHRLQETMDRVMPDRGIPIYRDPERVARTMAAVPEYYKIRDAMSGAV